MIKVQVNSSKAKVILIMGLVTLQLIIGFTFLPRQSGFKPVQPLIKRSSQVVKGFNQNYTNPSICISNISFPEGDLEEEKQIPLTILIDNEVPMDLSNLTLVIILIEQTNLRSEDENTVNFTKSLSSIPASSKINVTHNITSSAGRYMFSSYLVHSGKVIPTSTYTTQIIVLGPPIGDVALEIVILLVILTFILIIPLLPGIVERFRFKFWRRN